MMKVACAPKNVATPGATLRYVLYSHASTYTEGSIGPSIIQMVRKFGLSPSARAWDFLSIALSVIGADEGCRRNQSPDGWTRQIDLTVSVADPHFWAGHTQKLDAALCFLTGDIWNVSFIGGGILPTPPKIVKPRQEEAICLLSGGMDSLIGAIDLHAGGKKLLLVSQVSKGDKASQKYLAQAIAGPNAHLQLNHQAHPPHTSERSQRARSFVFFGFGVLAATSLSAYASGKTVDLYVPENGFISLNIPLTPMRLGSLSTRTTHPYFLGLLQDLLSAAGLSVRLVNPYQLMTKGEMLVGCKNQTFLKKHIGSTTSCGRYARTGFTHCGRCVPCLVRRAAFHHWDKDLTPKYRYDDLSRKSAKYKDFDDVRSVGMAIEAVKTLGFDRWVGGALNSAQLGDTAPYGQVAQRGLKELAAFLKDAGVL